MDNFTKMISRQIISLAITFGVVALVAWLLWLFGYADSFVVWVPKAGLIATVFLLQFGVFIALGRIKALTIRGPERSI
ncbi:MAG: hypothetical protein ING69_10860 [Rhodocyclaceae bacterium]|nr:hypothetical protein [Rhodocyclaceae bacterium]MCA3083142.1 hypothetical protein [Rhodocyclaceae bacterium]